MDDSFALILTGLLIILMIDIVPVLVMAILGWIVLIFRFIKNTWNKIFGF